MDVCDLDKVSSAAIIHYLCSQKKKNKKIKHLQRANWRLKNIFAGKYFMFVADVNRTHGFESEGGGTMPTWRTCWAEVAVLWLKEHRYHFISSSRSHWHTSVCPSGKSLRPFILYLGVFRLIFFPPFAQTGSVVSDECFGVNFAVDSTERALVLLGLQNTGTVCYKTGRKMGWEEPPEV